MFPVTTFIETICFLCGVFFLRNTGDVVWNTVRWFMLFTVINECVVTIIGHVYHKHNMWLVNIYTLVNFPTMSWILYRFSRRQKSSLIIFCISLFLFISCFITEIFYKGIFEYTVASNILSDILLFATCNRFFYLLLKDDSWIDIQRHAAFWFVTGLLLFSLCATIADVFDGQLASLYIFPHVSLYYILYMVFNLILYGCWSFSFICKYQETI